MYVAVRRYEGMTDPQRVAQVVREGFVPMISAGRDRLPSGIILTPS
jgi:hypothetical protein